jgi:hypothetical protein
MDMASGIHLPLARHDIDVRFEASDGVLNRRFLMAF